MISFKSLTTPLLSPEQKLRIYEQVEMLFAKERQAKEVAEAVLEKIDLLKKSILARTFRGELGTSAPAEESAPGTAEGNNLLKSVVALYVNCNSST